MLFQISFRLKQYVIMFVYLSDRLWNNDSFIFVCVQVIDLLNNSHRRYLQVRWSKNKGFYVENLFNVEVETIDDLMAVLEEGKTNR